MQGVAFTGRGGATGLGGVPYDTSAACAVLAADKVAGLLKCHAVLNARRPLHKPPTFVHEVSDH